MLTPNYLEWAPRFVQSHDQPDKPVWLLSEYTFGRPTRDAPTYLARVSRGLVALNQHISDPRGANVIDEFATEMYRALAHQAENEPEGLSKSDVAIRFRHDLVEAMTTSCYTGIDRNENDGLMLLWLDEHIKWLQEMDRNELLDKMEAKDMGNTEFYYQVQSPAVITALASNVERTTDADLRGSVYTLTALDPVQLPASTEVILSSKSF